MRQLTEEEANREDIRRLVAVFRRLLAIPFAGYGVEESDQWSELDDRYPEEERCEEPA